MSTALVSWIEPIATDNSGSQTLSSTHASGSQFDIGLTIVKYTAIDSAGNIDVVHFSVKVEGAIYIDCKLVNY